ncbi:ROK family protein [Microbacterium oleivorans]|uniref:ROK family protein n=1 Tax=Microbacterium oleivorans TaxID=273677 RepID=UPI0020425F0D|nr:ROK family protein [Microbacterium oleivorans]MCM3694880.1 ROK family protein [Microbacterium oleivorans]
MSTLASSPARPASQDAVLAFAWDSSEFTATDALQSTGLTRSTTIEATDALVARGLLRELPNARLAGDYRKGRPARRFALRDDAAVVIGVDAGHEHVSVAVADLRGKQIADADARLVMDRDDAAARAAVVSDTIDRALAAAGLSRSDVLAVCAGVPAPVDRTGRSPRHPTRFWERMNPDLVDVLSWAPVVRIENDASLAAVAEGSVGAAVGCRDYIALLAGSRLGAGVVVDGHLLRGSHGGVGEMVAFDHVDGVHGAEGLGSRASDLARELVRSGKATAGLRGVALEALDARTVLGMAAQGDADARRIVDRVGLTLARIVSVLGSMFDPERVVVSGAIADGVDEVVAAARRSLPTDLDLPAPELVASTLGGEVVVIGAVAAAVASARERVLDVWGAAD